MGIILRDLFDDPNLPQWDVYADTGHVVRQGSETVTRSGVTYTRDYLYIEYNGSKNSGNAYAMHSFGKELSKGALRVVVRTSSSPPSGKVIPVVTLFSSSHNTGIIAINIDDLGRVDVVYFNGNGAAHAKSYRTVNDGSEHVIYMDWDKDRERIKIVVDGDEEINVSDWLPYAGWVPDSIVLGVIKDSLGFDFKLYIESIIVADNYPSPAYTVDAVSYLQTSHRGVSRELGIYALGIIKSDGSCAVQIRKISDDSLVSEIDLGVTLDARDPHNYVSTYFFKINGVTKMYVVVSRHCDVFDYFVIDPVALRIEERKRVNVSATYVQLAVYRGRVAAFYRKGSSTDTARPLAMYIIDEGREIIVVDAPSGIWIYPVTKGIDMFGGNRIAVAWSFYDQGSGTRNNVYLLIYDPDRDAWIAFNGSVKSVPVAYNDSDCLVSTQYNNVELIEYRNELYMVLTRFYGKALSKLYRYVPSAGNVEPVTDIGMADEARLTYNGKTVFGLVDREFNFYMRTLEIYDITVPRGRTLGFVYIVDCGNKVLVVDTYANKMDVYCFVYSNDDPPYDEFVYSPTMEQRVRQVAEMSIGVALQMMVVMLMIVMAAMMMFMIARMVQRIATVHEHAR